MEEEQGFKVFTTVELAYMTRSFLSILAPFHKMEWFTPFFYSCAVMRPDEADVLLNVVRTSAFQTLAHLLRQNVPLDVDHVGRFTAATAPFGDMISVMKRMSRHPKLKEYGVSKVKFLKDDFLSIGKNVEIATNFAKAIIMCTDENNLDALIADVGAPFSRAWSILNTTQFKFMIEGKLQQSEKHEKFVQEYMEIVRVLAEFTVFSDFASLIALYLLDDMIPNQFEEWCGVRQQNGVKVASELIRVYGVSDVEDICDVFDLNDDLKIDGQTGLTCDPDFITKNKIGYELLNGPLAAQRVVDEKNSADVFAQKLSIIDDIGERQRGLRSNKEDWDIKSNRLSRLTDTDPALAKMMHYLNLYKGKDVSYHIVAGESNIFYDHVTALSNNVSLLKNADYTPRNHWAENVRVVDRNNFYGGIDDRRDKSIVIIDDLQLKKNAELNKVWITAGVNESKMLDQLQMMRVILRGDASATRFPIDHAARIIVWRTFSPFTKKTYNAFDEIITRLDAYYRIKYIPPSKPHELQFTLICIRRTAIERNKFYLAEGRKVKRKANFILRFADYWRRYYGIIHRQNVYDHVLSQLSMHVIRSIYLKLIAKSTLISDDPDVYAREYQLQMQNFTPEQVNAANEYIVEYVGVSSKRTAKGEKKAKGDSVKKFINRMNDDVLELFSAHNKTSEQDDNEYDDDE